MTITIEALAAERAAACAGMTFPAYRHLVTLEAAPRHPDQGDDRIVQPIGCVARAGEDLVGLALAELPLAGDARSPELLSVFVQPRARGRGVATELVAAVVSAVRQRGFGELVAVYMTGKPAIPAFERVLEKCGFDAPEARTVTLRFTPEQATRTPWFGRVRLPAGAELFPWSELGSGERDAIRRSQERARWIVPELEPWRHDRYGFDAVSSLGVRYAGQVVGWVINHRIALDVVRFTCSFMRKDLSRRGRIMTLYTASLERLHASGCRECVFVTPTCYPTMVSFVRKRCAPWANFFGETRGARRRL